MSSQGAKVKYKDSLWCILHCPWGNVMPGILITRLWSHILTRSFISAPCMRGVWDFVQTHSYVTWFLRLGKTDQRVKINLSTQHRCSLRVCHDVLGPKLQANVLELFSSTAHSFTLWDLCVWPSWATILAAELWLGSTGLGRWARTH